MSPHAATGGALPASSPAPTGQGAFGGVSGGLFIASVAATLFWCESMSAMGGMPMPGGWSLSMAWMRMAGQTWAGAAASFVGMWITMMLAMMLPALWPMLVRYRETVGCRGGATLGWLTTVVGAGYFLVWAAVGLAVYPLGIALAALAMRHAALARAVPLAMGSVVLLAGLLQLTAWKTRRLACCRDARPTAVLAATAGTAWRHGLRLGLRCCGCCANLTAILLAIGVMDLTVMCAVAAAITAERLAPARARAPRVVGVLAVGAGLLLIARAAALR